MSRGFLLLIILVILVAGALFFLSGQAGEVPQEPIEVEVNASGDAN